MSVSSMLSKSMSNMSLSDKSSETASTTPVSSAGRGSQPAQSISSPRSKQGANSPEMSSNIKLELESPFDPPAKDIPLYRRWSLAPAKFSPGLSSCFLKYHDKVVGSYSSFLSEAYQGILYTVGVSLIFVCSVVFSFDAYSRARKQWGKGPVQFASAKEEKSAFKRIKKSANELFKLLHESQWTRGIAMAGSAVGAVTIFITQGLQKSFLYREDDRLAIRATPTPSQQGMYDIEQTNLQNETSKHFKLFPNMKTGNWELYSHRSNAASARQQQLEGNRSESANAKLEQSVKGMTLELSVPSRLKKGVRVRQEQDDFTFDVNEFSVLDLDVDLPGLGRSSVPFALSGYGQNFKITLPASRKDDDVHKLYAFVCYIARTCSIIPLDILMVLAATSGIPYLAYRGASSIKNFFVNAKEKERRNEEEIVENSTKEYQDGDDRERQTKRSGILNESITQSAAAQSAIALEKDTSANRADGIRMSEKPVHQLSLKNTQTKLSTSENGSRTSGQRRELAAKTSTPITPLITSKNRASRQIKLHAAKAASEATPMKIIVKFLDGRIITVDTKSTDTIKVVKQQIKAAKGIDPDQQRLMFDGATLQDDRTLADYSMTDNFTLTLSIGNYHQDVDPPNESENDENFDNTNSPPSPPSSPSSPSSAEPEKRVEPQAAATAAAVAAAVAAVAAAVAAEKEQETSQEASQKSVKQIDLLQKTYKELEEATSEERQIAKENLEKALTKHQQLTQKGVEDFFRSIIARHKATAAKEELRAAEARNKLTQAAAAAKTSMKIFVKFLNGKIITVDTESSDTIEVIKKIIETKEKISQNRQKLIFNGKQLEDGHTLAYYSIPDGSSLNFLHHWDDPSTPAAAEVEVDASIPAVGKTKTKTTNENKHKSKSTNTDTITTKDAIKDSRHSIRNFFFFFT